MTKYNLYKFNKKLLKDIYTAEREVRAGKTFSGNLKELLKKFSLSK